MRWKWACPSHVNLFGYLWWSKTTKKKLFKLRKNFNNSDLGALDVIVDKIIDKSSITAAGSGVQSLNLKAIVCRYLLPVIDIE
jgi:hypothetical protein